MNDVEDSRLIGMLRRVIRDCHKLYHHSGNWMVRRHPNLIEGRAVDFVRLMEDLHRGLLIKVYVTIVRADDRWTGPEKRVASEMIEHLWGQKLHGAELREAATGLFQQADQLKWESLVAPFVRYEPLADSRVQVETIVMRLANLVAKCDGQTGPKTNKLCDSSLGGVLFIDEAYSLVDASGDDAYGREAIQTLLKRMEDDRERVAVILAGYCDEMNDMIRSNPGLSSRVNTRIEFDDYSPIEMGKIFEMMCKQNQYQLQSAARHRLLLGLHYLYEKRDRHFGNGRIVCDGCNRKVKIDPDSLGLRVKCGKCQHIQMADWADVKAI